MSGNFMRSMSKVVTLLMVVVVLSHAQDRWQWPDKPKNLKVLPKDWTGKQLNPVMRGFTRALGVRCIFCHVGEEGKPLSTYDFASDAKPNKDRAREMYRMLADINAHLKKIEPSGDKRVNMWCNTCHRGRPRPTTLAEELGESYRANGIEGALTRYADLKKKYYGRGTLDFGEGSLKDFSDQLLETRDFTGAIQVLKLNTDQFPESADAWQGLAEAYLKSGDRKMAEQYGQKALMLDARNREANQMMRALRDSTQK